ncbi:MAG: hypothetical protein AAF141_03060, partial [Pseudomonadota bacterium]
MTRINSLMRHSARQLAQHVKQFGLKGQLVSVVVSPEWPPRWSQFLGPVTFKNVHSLSKSRCLGRVM